MIERYTRPAMGRIWTIENRYQKFLEVELAASWSLARLGIIPQEAAQALEQNASFSVERILELEKSTRHDVVAFTRCVAENLGPESRYLHYGLTSYDVVDTALSLLLREAVNLLEEGLIALISAVQDQAIRYRDTVMVGRTHGVHAEPVTLGLKLALWWDELNRHYQRLLSAREAISYGKISGAVGTFAHLDPRVEEDVCRQLGLKPAPVSTQILQRDGHAELILVLALLASSLDKIAVEIRNLQRTEVREVEEPFYQGQKGSSAMPHKKNPVSCEQLSGLSRLLRAHAQVALENIPLWHERDISHSSAERIIFPDATILTDYMLHQLIRIIRDLVVYPEQMKENLEKTRGLVFSQSVLLALVEKGLSREEAYDIVQEMAMRSWEEGTSFRQLLKREKRVTALLEEEELDACFDYKKNLRHVPAIFQRLGLIAGNKGKGAVLLKNVKKGDFLYEGKAKKIFSTSNPDCLFVEYKDVATAFDGLKKESLEDKGILNNKIAALFFELLEKEGIPNHYLQLVSEREMLVKALEIIPVEIIVRNIAAGSLAKRLNLEEGTPMKKTILEFNLKNDELHDPMLNHDHIYALELATPEEMARIEVQAHKVNSILQEYLREKNIILVDFKLEFGRFKGEIILGDEISPDTCRFWDSSSKEKLDKDRFRRDLGGVTEAYREVLRRLEE